MGFSVGRYAKIWKLEKRGKYAVANMSISKKNKDTGTYSVEFKDGFVSVVGAAYETLKDAVIDENKGLSVKIVSCDVTNVFTNASGNVSYKPHYTLFAVELPNTDGNNQASATAKDSANNDGVNDFMNISEGEEEELPFN